MLDIVQQEHYTKPLGRFIFVFIIDDVSNKDHQDYKEGLAVDKKCTCFASYHTGQPFFLEVNNKKWLITTECPKIYRKTVLHLFRYRFAAYLSRCSTDLRKIWDTQ